MAVIGGVATVTQLALSEPPLLAPTSIEWIWTAPNPWVGLTALMSALGAVSAAYGFLQPSAYTEREARKAHDRIKRSFGAADQRQAARHDESMLAQVATRELIGRDKHEQALQELQKPDADPLLIAEYERALSTARGRSIAITEAQAADIASIARRTAISNRASDLEVAALIAQGEYREAARLKAHFAHSQLRETRREQAAEFRDAAFLALPFAPVESKRYFEYSVGLDPTDCWTWICLGRLNLLYETPEAARSCFLSALKCTINERDLSVIHIELGSVLLVEGRLEKARSEFEAALAIDTTLAVETPEDRMLERDLWVCHNRLGELEVMAGDYKAALSHFNVGLDIIQGLLKEDPKNELFLRDCSISHKLIGQLMIDQDPKVARYHYQNSFSISNALFENNPMSVERARDLSMSYRSIGNVELEEGDFEAAHNNYQNALKILEGLLRAEPDSPVWREDLSRLHLGLGRIAYAANEKREAQRHYKHALYLLNDLHLENEAKVSVQYEMFVINLIKYRVDVSLSEHIEAHRSFSIARSIAEEIIDSKVVVLSNLYELCKIAFELGDMELSNGKFETARARYEEAIELSKFFEREAGGSYEWKRLHSYELDRMAFMEISFDNYPAAEEYCKENLVIIAGLLNVRPDDENLHFELGRNYARLAEIADRKKDDENALRYYRECENIMMPIIKKFPNRKDFSGILDIVQSQLSRLKG